MNLLLAEDDAVSRDFLSEVLRCAGHHIHAVSDGSTALEFAKARAFDLLLLDLNLPGMRGDQLLNTLREDGASASGPNRHTPAIALTADLDSAQRARLLGAGFSDAIGKPVPADVLVALVAGRHSSPAPSLVTVNTASGSMPLWDDATALSIAGGNQGSVAALRGLFRNELPSQRQRMQAAIGADDVAVLAAELHRLRASCGFCGAAKLGEAARALSAEIASGGAVTRRASGSLIDALDEVLQSLDEPTSGSTTSP